MKLECCRCGKPFNQCEGMHPIDPPGTPNRRWACFDCETSAEKASVPKEVTEIENIILEDNKKRREP